MQDDLVYIFWQELKFIFVLALGFVFGICGMIGLLIFLLKGLGA